LKQVIAGVVSNTEIMSGVNLMWLEAPDIAAAAQPGQFISVRCEDFVLRRPFSIHQVNSNRIAVLFKVVGGGTLWLSRRQPSDKLDVLGPLGNGFSIPPFIARGEVARQSRNLLLLAGGIGIAPLVFLAQHAFSQHSITLIHGASTAEELYPLSWLRKPIRFMPVTEDGSKGRKGMVTDVLPDFLDWADHVYACAPLDMYKTMADLAVAPSRSKGERKGEGEKRGEESKLRKCQISLEVRMGCGIGACYGCTINTNRGLKKVCRDGPVFELDDILWEDVRL